MDLYMSIMFKKSPLKRYQREMIATVVSASNNCEYCFVHHGKALDHYWKDWTKVEQLRTDYLEAGLSVPDQKLCEFADQLTTDPGAKKRDERVEELRKVGFDDRSILDASLVVSYFNFVNRLVLGLGVDLEDDDGGGYKYE